jgi:benzoate-CoA ligase family protein
VNPTFPEQFNLAEYLLDDRVDEGKGEQIAIEHGDRSYTYEDVWHKSNQMAYYLRGVGVGIEQRVLIALPDCPMFAFALFGALKIGAVVTMVNPDLPDEDYRYYLDYTRARTMICDDALFERIRPIAARARHLGSTLRRNGGMEEHLAQMPTWFLNEPTHRDDVALWLFTSGSTGKPKGAVHTHADFAYNIETYAKQVLGMKASDVTLSVPRLFFGYATGTNLFFPFAVGARTVLSEDRPTPERMVELIERHRPTVLTSVPTMIGKMLAVEGAAQKDLSSLRVTISAGEALPEELYRRWTETYKSEILDGIGSAELFHIYISNRFGEVRPGTLGKVVPGYEVRLVDDDGKDVADGQIGSVWVRGGSSLMWYWNDKPKTREVVRGEWIVSGDKMSRDADGYYTYHGRGDDLLKVGGIFVSPIEVEGVLMEHPGILECCVVGYEDEEKLVKARAVVVVRDGVARDETLAEQLIGLARRKLAHYKVPKRVDFVASLPRSDRGKILRKDVK